MNDNHYLTVKYFSRWFKENSHRFNHKPLIIEKSKTHIRLQYDGIISDISPMICPGGIELAVYHNDPEHYFDLICEFEIEVYKMGKKIYCCKMCKDYWDEKNTDKSLNLKKYIIYDSAQELIIKHTYEEFLKWTNKNIKESNYLILQGHSRSWRGTMIVHKNKLKEHLGNELIQISSLREYKA